jgi:MOSC domain-containing protein YiiM
VTARLASVNVGTPRTVTWGGRAVTSAIWKTPVGARVHMAGVNLAGDDQADRRVHGGRDKAVYAYAVEDYAWWAGELGPENGIELGPGTFGENLSTEGIDLQSCVVGQRWKIGSAELEVAQPRSPCFKLGMRMGDAAFVDRFEAAQRCGAYLRIIAAGDVGAGDAIVAGPTPGHGLTIAELARVETNGSRAELERIAAVADLPEKWRARVRRRLAALDGRPDAS